jgi:hypothetical protein
MRMSAIKNTLNQYGHKSSEQKKIAVQNSVGLNLVEN